MSSVKVIKGRGALVVVEAHGEVLFLPGGPVRDWKNRFSARAKVNVAKFAPSNSRPRWAHYGSKTLKTSIDRSRTKLGAGGKRLYSTVGSTVPYALFVDQGTGIHNGGAPYVAKILPPYTWGSPSLYEHTSKFPSAGPERWSRVSEVLIDGQEGQHFFDKGIAATFANMGLRSRHVANEPKVGAVLGSVPHGLDIPGSGNTPASAAFGAQLEEWRDWRDAAFRQGRILGLGYVNERERRERRDVRNTIAGAQRRELSAREKRERERQRSQRRRDEAKAKGGKPDGRRKENRNKQRRDEGIAKGGFDRMKEDLRQAFLTSLVTRSDLRVKRDSMRFVGDHWEVKASQRVVTKGGIVRWVDRTFTSPAIKRK